MSTPFDRPPHGFRPEQSRLPADVTLPAYGRGRAPQQDKPPRRLSQRDLVALSLLLCPDRANSPRAAES